MKIMRAIEISSVKGVRRFIFPTSRFLNICLKKILSESDGGGIKKSDEALSILRFIT